MRLCRVVLGWFGCVLGEVDITGFSGKDLGRRLVLVQGILIYILLAFKDTEICTCEMSQLECQDPSISH